MSAKEEDARPAASPSGSSSLAPKASVRSQRTQASSVIRPPIVTSPPWARDEPPSPDDEEHDGQTDSVALKPRPSQSALSTTTATTTSATVTSRNAALAPAASTSSMAQKDDAPLWWMFTRRGRQEGPPQPAQQNNASAAPAAGRQYNLNWSTLVRDTASNSRSGVSGEKPPSEKPRMRERARTMWLSGVRNNGGNNANTGDSLDSDIERQQQPRTSESEGYSSGTESPTNARKGFPRRKTRGLHIPLPTPAPFTLAQTRTPGWDTPWSGGAASQNWRIASRTSTNFIGQGSNLGVRDYAQLNGNASEQQSGQQGQNDDGRTRSKWYRRRKRIRAFVLSNNYVPLLFRVINITLTTAALAVAITIRRTEKRYAILGAVGSSPILVIIFAPLTLVHVMLAIYLEYFGRPLGLWRTSSKLFHTLSETLFICAWSAALSLCFDNFFTSVLGCAPVSSTRWFSDLPRIVPSVPHLGRGPGEPGDSICHHQVALICLVFLGLAMYCFNLCISLFRIFEKVKYHPANGLPR